MTAPKLRIPKTHLELAELLHERFGFGGYDEIASPEPPLWQRMNVEAARMKRMMTKRRCSFEDLAIAVWWLQQTGALVTAEWQVFEAVPKARIEYRRALLVKSGRERLLAAAQQASEMGADSWAARLFAAHESAADDLIAQWEAARQ